MSTRSDSFALRRWLLSLALLVLSFGCATGVVSLAPSIALPAHATGESDPVYVRPSLIADCKAIVPGKKFKLGVELKQEPGWHTYYKESGEAGMPTRINWQLPEGFKAGDLLWEMPHKLVDSGITTYGYNDRTLIAAEIDVPASAKPGDKLTFKANVKWLSCKDACIPGSGDVELSLPVVADPAAAAPDNVDKFQKANFNGPISAIKADGGVPGGAGKKPDESEVLKASFQVTGNEQPQAGLMTYLGFAFIGGFILNFMPCVLPVISIKVFSLVQQAGEDPKRVFQHGVTFAGGIIASFLALGGLIIAIQSAGQKIGWGFQFQYPVFVLGMASIVTVFALSMFGVFYINVTAGQQSIDKLASAEGLTGTFFKGVLATVLSTPCTAPFLGTALGFAFVQPWWQILTIFAVIALGMSSPYLVLAVRPNWMKFLPRPGAWMEKFKESLGFLLLATTVWLLSVLVGLVDPDAVVSSVGFLLCLGLASWVVGGFIDLTSTGQRKFVVWILALVVVAAGYWAFLRPFPELLGTKATKGQKRQVDGIDWQNFTLAELDKNLKANKTVFIDFTAQWCLTCKANEATIINTPEVIERFKALNVVPLKADWTAQDPEISDLLRKFGRSGVPVYVVFPAGHPNEPVVLPEVISKQIVIDALNKAGASK
jgi:thiol:disulfide interchange protein